VIFDKFNVQLRIRIKPQIPDPTKSCGSLQIRIQNTGAVPVPVSYTVLYNLCSGTWWQDGQVYAFLSAAPVNSWPQPVHQDWSAGTASGLHSYAKQTILHFFKRCIYKTSNDKTSTIKKTSTTTKRLKWDFAVRKLTTFCSSRRAVIVDVLKCRRFVLSTFVFDVLSFDVLY
jgi:hypothetical protein